MMSNNAAGGEGDCTNSRMSVILTLLPSTVNFTCIPIMVNEQQHNRQLDELLLFYPFWVRTPCVRVKVGLKELVSVDVTI